MKKTISKSFYFYIAIILIIVGTIVKYFLVDTDLGARFKDFNNELLSSDIIFLSALILGLIGFILNSIRNNKKANLKDSTIFLSEILILPMIIVISFTPILMTIYSGEIGDNIFGTIFTFLVLIGTFGLFAWVLLIFVTLIKQIYFILKK